MYARTNHILTLLGAFAILTLVLSEVFIQLGPTGYWLMHDGFLYWFLPLAMLTAAVVLIDHRRAGDGD